MVNFSYEEPDYVEDYYNFIVNKLKSLNVKIDFTVFGLGKVEKKSGRICFVNYEHNLVKPYINYPLIGKTPLLLDKNVYYLVRVENIPAFIECDIYFEYSMPNVENLKSCDLIKDYLRKVFYFPPLLCKYSPESNDRNNFDVITSFYILNPDGRPRRQVLHDKLNSQDFKYLNLPKVFDVELYERYYKKSKVLVNVHQTDFHDTFEELRVLPALLNGLVIIAEDSPLKEFIPYHEYIIWCKYEDIVEKTNEVLKNYEYYFNKIHGTESNLKSILENMSLDLDNRINKII